MHALTKQENVDLIIIHCRYVQRRGLKEETYYFDLLNKEETYFDLLNIKDDTPIEYFLGVPAECSSPMHLACLHGHEEVFQLLRYSKHFNVHM